MTFSSIAAALSGRAASAAGRSISSGYLLTASALAPIVVRPTSRGFAKVPYLQETKTVGP